MRRLVRAGLWSLAVVALMTAAVLAQSTTGVLMPGQTGITGLAMPDGSDAAPSYSFENCTTCGLNYSANSGNPYIRLNGQAATGTNATGGDLTLTAGVGTGTGRGGWIRLQIGIASSSSGSTAQTLQNGFFLSGTNGAVSSGQIVVEGTPGEAAYAAASRATGTSNGAGGDLSLQAGQGTGTGNGGTLRIKVAAPGASGSTQNTLTSILTASGSTGDLTLATATPNGSNAGHIFITGRTFTTLGTPANGAIAYCSDCTIASPCAGSGTGALAKRLNGVWVCN